MTKYSDAIIVTALARVSSEMDRIASIRQKNQSFALAIVGAVLAFSATSTSTAIPVLIGIAATLVVAAFAWQDRVLHRYRHGWFKSDMRTREYIWGTLGEDDFKPLEYRRKDEESAEFFSKSSGWLYVVLFLGGTASTLLPFMK